MESPVIKSVIQNKKMLHNFKHIIEITCHVFNVEVPRMESIDKHRDVAECRHVIAYLLNKRLNLRPSKITVYLGNRHRSTIVASISTCINLLETDKTFKAKLVKVEEMVGILCN